AYLIVLLGWQQQLGSNSDLRFHEAWTAWLMHFIASAMIVVAIVVLIKKRGWLRNIVLLAFSFLLLGEALLLINYATNHIYNYIICPIGNSFHIWAVPLFGYVYFREQAIEKSMAETALATYRDHLEELVASRTAALTQSNKHLQREISVRQHAEAEIVQRNAELAAQNEIAATISRSLELNTILNAVLDRTLQVLEIASGCIYLNDPNKKDSFLQFHKEKDLPVQQLVDQQKKHLCADISKKAMHESNQVLVDLTEQADADQKDFDQDSGLKILVSTPLVAQGRIVGALTVGTKRKDVFVPQKLALLTAVSQQIGMAVENVRMYKQLEKTAALEERQRIAADMHDGLAQTLSYLSLKTDRALELLESDKVTAVFDLFQQIQNAIARAIVDVRRSIASLQEAPQPRQSVQDALAQVIKDYAKDNEIIPTMHTTITTPLFLPTDETGQLICVVQEALINARKHGNAKNITVLLKKTNSHWQITVEDDGQGFDVDLVSANGNDHFGLSIMQARAAQISGTLSIKSNLGQGTQIMLSWPQVINQTPSMHTATIFKES
ncbi:MAG: GAF domain-containing protein, partial [Anaerolineales bacterium]|nr:GAF domain-containing protein [Anaerolineales bacterium]